MCGICGFVTKQRVTVEQLKDMNDTMYHRGPNDSGEEIFDACDGYSVGLAQRRLSVLDLSNLGHQPMHSENARLSLVYNGEIYNYLELKEELSEYPFHSNCDTEVILASYLKWGISCVSRFQGMFAFALYDKESHELYLVRDRMGKKPLYYYFDGTELIFASELKPIMQFPNRGLSVRTDVIKRFLYQQYINAPDTIYHKVYKVEPASVVCLKDMKVTMHKFWDLKEIYWQQKQLGAPDYETAKKELKELLRQATKRRMIADVPLGAFLSGGYDSSLITAIAQEIGTEPVKTYSIGFEDRNYNEADYAKKIASYLGTRHTELYIGEAEMLQMVDSIPQFYDEPFADSSQIPMMLVSKLAAGEVTVALSGDGGDELFCGYNLYRKIAQAQRLDSYGKAVDCLCKVPPFAQLGLREKLPFRVRAIADNRNPACQTQLASMHYLQAVDGMVLKDSLDCRYQQEEAYKERNWQERRMLLDMDTYLPGDILCKVDRASMKYSLEARCPILDTDVMEYAFRLPHSYKYEKGNKKRILKDIAYDYIPKALLERPKVGFSVPLDKWLRGAFREQLLEMSGEQYLHKQAIFDASYMSRFIKAYIRQGDAGSGSGANYSRIVWAFFIFQQWFGYQQKG